MKNNKLKQPDTADTTEMCFVNKENTKKNVFKRQRSSSTSKRSSFINFTNNDLTSKYSEVSFNIIIWPSQDCFTRVPNYNLCVQRITSKDLFLYDICTDNTAKFESPNFVNNALKNIHLPRNDNKESMKNIKQEMALKQIRQKLTSYPFYFHVFLLNHR